MTSVLAWARAVFVMFVTWLCSGTARRGRDGGAGHEQQQPPERAADPAAPQPQLPHGHPVSTARGEPSLSPCPANRACISFKSLSKQFQMLWTDVRCDVAKE